MLKAQYSCFLCRFVQLITEDQFTYSVLSINYIVKVRPLFYLNAHFWYVCTVGNHTIIVFLDVRDNICICKTNIRVSCKSFTVQNAHACIISTTGGFYIKL